MDNFSYMFAYVMERATTMMVYLMFAVLIDKTLEAKRERAKTALGHEPTQENMHYLYELEQEKAKRQNDREKLRRLVFGEDESNPKAG